MMRWKLRPWHHGRRVRVMANQTIPRHISPRAGFLFAEPGALQGAARVFDAWGVYDDYNLGESLEHAVAVGFVQDWLSLENDVFESLSKRQIA